MKYCSDENIKHANSHVLDEHVVLLDVYCTSFLCIMATTGPVSLLLK